MRVPLHDIGSVGVDHLYLLRIPLERGREIATRYGVSPLLAPLFDFTPSSTSLGSLPAANNTAPQRPLSTSSSFPAAGPSQPYSQPSLAPPPIMPGSALRLLNQGRAQGLFTPSTSAAVLSRSMVYPPTTLQGSYAQSSAAPSLQQPLKRARSDSEVIVNTQSTLHSFDSQSSSQPFLEPPADIHMVDSAQLSISQHPEDDGASPPKRFRKEPTPTPSEASQSHHSSQPANYFQPSLPRDHHMSNVNASSPQPQSQEGSSRAPSLGTSTNGKLLNGADGESHTSRFSTKPAVIRDSSILRDPRRMQLIAAICQQDDPAPVLEHLRSLTLDPSLPIDVDTVIDDKGHTALHLAATMARQHIVDQLIAVGADIHRGNFAGETPLIRASIDTHNFDQQTFHGIVASLRRSIRTLDTSRKSVLHHIVYLAGIQGRAVCARYYLDQTLMWIAQHQGGDFRSIVDLQDEHGDTALNIAARVGNRSLVRTLLDIGANRTLPNKLGLRPGDFGVEVEVSGRSSDVDTADELSS